MDPLSFKLMIEGVVAIVGFTALGGLTFFWYKRMALNAAQKPPLDDDRLRRLEAAVDSIAIEVERISESQRFSAKLLAQREVEATKKLS